MKMLFSALMVAALAAPSTAQERVALSVLIDEALASHPRISAAQRRAAAASERIAQERSLPDPMVSVGYTSVGRPWPGAGLGTDPNANIGFVVSQELPYPGKRDLAGLIATREADAERTQIDATRYAIVARVKQAYYALAYTYAVGDVLSRNQELLDTLLKVSEGRYAVGHAAQLDVIRAQTELSILALREQRIHQERTAREGELKALLGRSADAPLRRPDDLILVPFEHSLPWLVALADEQAPMLRRDRLLVDGAALGVDAARNESRPDFALSGGYASMGSMPPMYEVRFDVVLPLRRTRRAAAVAEQSGLLSGARHDYQADRLEIQGRLQEDFALATTSLQLARRYRDTVLPQARLGLESSMASYQTGRVDFLSVLTSFGSVLEYEMTYFEELVRFHEAVSRVEELIGAPLAH